MNLSEGKRIRLVYVSHVINTVGGGSKWWAGTRETEVRLHG